MKHIGFIALLFLLCVTASAHDILRIQTLTDRNGLSQNTVRCMMQDSRGFIWMGTINGLNRYNGKEFTVIQPRTPASPSLSDNRIRSIKEDKNGYIWVRSFSNTVSCYDPRMETFIDYNPQNESKVFSEIKVAENGDVWLWGNQGFCRIRFTNGKPEVWYPVEDKRESRTVSFMLEDSKHRLWVGMDKEVVCITDDKASIPLQGSKFRNAHEANGRIYLLADDRIAVYDCTRQAFLPDISVPKSWATLSFRSSLLNNGVIMIANKEDVYALDTRQRSISLAHSYFRGNRLQNASFLVDNKGAQWVYCGSGVLWKHLPDNTFEPLALIPSDILSLISLERFSIYHDSRDIIWISTFGNGLFAIDTSNGQTYHYTAETGKELPTNYLLCVTEDRSGEIWVGTELGGVVKITLSNYPFDVFYPNPHGNADRDNAVRLIYEDSDGQFWFGTRNGYLYVCDKDLRQTAVHRMADGLPFTIAEDTLGYKWLGTKGSGVLIFPPKGNAAPQTYRLNDRERQTSSSNNIFTILRDTKNRMWAASFGGGLHLGERQNGKLTFRQIFFPNEHHNMMRSMIQDRNGLIWIGCNDGVIVVDPDRIIRDPNSYISLSLDAQNLRSLSSDEVRVVYEDSQGRIWMGATGGGLNLLMREAPLKHSWFKHYNAQNGLSNEMIQAIQEDKAGNIWVSTESGISRFDPKSERFENFVFSSRMTAFNENSVWKKANGELMFGSYNGVYCFDPSQITYDTYAPPVLLTGIRINGNHTYPGAADSPLDSSITTSESICLNHNQNSFNLEFTLMNFHASEFNQYMYYLAGYEKEWNPMSFNNIATYRNVPPGTYRFKVKGCNSFGVWSDEETSLEIVILPPWWKSGWALFAYLLILAAMGCFAYRLMIKMHRLNTAVEVEKQLTEYKLRFFTNISHEFRTPLTIIRGSIENLAAQQNLPPSVGQQIHTLTKSSTRLLRLIDQLLEFRRLQNNKMELNLEITEVESFFKDIYQTFRELAEKKQIDFRFEADTARLMMLIDRSKMDKIAYNLLSNAFKNTPTSGTIVMSLHRTAGNDTITLSVSDSGGGVPNDQRDLLFVRFKQISYASDGTGIGLHLTAELVKVHKGNIAYSESEWGGACFSVTIPVSETNYDKSDILANQPSEKVATTIVQESEPLTEVDRLEPTVAKPFSDYRVMVIEDDDEVRAFIESQLDQYFTVSTAVNGAEGLRKVAEEQPDIVVCDVMMPEMDGYEFTRRLKSEFETSHIPVILLTAYSSEEHQLKGIQAGADSYITKPFSIKYLLTRIVKLIEQRERLQQKFTQEPGLIQSTIGATDRDKAFLDKLHEVIEENISNADFKIEVFAQSLNMGRTTFFRKLKGMTGYAPNEYLRVIRMKKAAELLMDTDLNVAEISYKVGISDPFYLSRCFKTQFGKSPSQFRKSE